MPEDYVQQYTFIALLTGTAIFFGIAPLVLAHFISPKKPGQTKGAAYECGLESTGEPWAQFRVQYYIYALLFVIFDVEVIFIFPWALIWRELGPAALAVMSVFLGILAVGLIYEWKRGVLEWE